MKKKQATAAKQPSRRILPGIWGRRAGCALVPGIIAAVVIISGCAHTSKTAHPGAGTSKPALTNKNKFDTTATVKLGTQTKDTAAIPLSKASELILRTCDNYLVINPESPKTAEVLGIKASIYYNNRYFPQSREIYEQIYQKFPKTQSALEAVRMIAQAFYEEKKFDNAQEWYRKLKDIAGEGDDRNEAITRIAESIFRMAEKYEQESRYKNAAEQYERVALEFPESKIADIALYNAGLSYEKLTEWSHAILVFQRLLQKYTESKMQPRALFRIAKCYEKLSQWDNAGETYLRVTVNFPRSDLAATSIYNAGFSFENANKLPEAAATFEKMAQLFPSSDDIADVLFRAGEIYGKIKDWESVGRVNQQFAQRFGNDADRVVQAQCMVGIAMYMQNKEDGAIDQLTKALRTYDRIKNPSTVNAYYAAKAQYTIAEIFESRMLRIELGKPRNAYKKQLADKSELAESAVEAYSKTIKFNISEWTTRSIFQIGQTYEEFALGIFKQERPPDQGIDERLSLELGIAQAVEKYFIEKAAYYHEQNVKLGIKEKLMEDKFVAQSRQKLTYLPYVAGENYLALAEIAKNAEAARKTEGFALIAGKLGLLQKIAPYQERAIDLFLNCLEYGTKYRQADEFYQKASTKITGISFDVGETYSDLVSIARDAPIPENFDEYEKFVYKSKLLKQIQDYEDQALTNYIKTLKIAEAYKLDDASVRQSKEKIAQVLFNRGRCYDLLCASAFSNPPYPRDINEAEKEEYRARFEEVGLKFQEQAFEIYKTILNYANQKYASGEYVTHAYVRLYQNSPDEYGVKADTIRNAVITSGPEWKCSGDSAPGWTTFNFTDSTWHKAQKAAATVKSLPLSEFKDKTPLFMWFGKGNPDDTACIPERVVYFRRDFQIVEMPENGVFYIVKKDSADLYFNGLRMNPDSGTVQGPLLSWDVRGKLKTGRNVIAARVAFKSKGRENGFCPILRIAIPSKQAMPRIPGSDTILSPGDVRNDVYVFPYIKNFSREPVAEVKK